MNRWKGGGRLEAGICRSRVPYGRVEAVVMRWQGLSKRSSSCCVVITGRLAQDSRTSPAQNQSRNPGCDHPTKQQQRQCSQEVRTWKGMRAVTRQYRTIPTPHTSTGYRLQALL